MPDAARELLRRKAWGHVITRNASGSPQVTMVCVDEANGDLVFNPTVDRKKGPNLAADARVVVSVQDVENPQRYLVVRGQTEIATDGAAEHINKLAHKFMGTDYTTSLEGRVIVRVKATRSSGAGPWMQS